MKSGGKDSNGENTGRDCSSVCARSGLTECVERCWFEEA